MDLRGRSDSPPPSLPVSSRVARRRGLPEAYPKGGETRWTRLQSATPQPRLNPSTYSPRWARGSGPSSLGQPTDCWSAKGLTLARRPLLTAHLERLGHSVPRPDKELDGSRQLLNAFFLVYRFLLRLP